MTRQQAKEFVKRNYYVDVDNEDYCALIKLRHTCLIFPEISINGQLRDDAEWAFIDTANKIDTGEYGAIFYIRENETDFREPIIYDEPF